MRTKPASYYLPAVISSLLLIAFALFVFPIPGTDSLVFLPPALAYAQGHGFTNPLYYVDKFTDPTHTHRFNYYVPFFPWLMGMVGRIFADVRTIFLFCAALGASGLVLYARQGIKALPGSDRYLTWGFVLSFFYLPIFFLPTVSRPENLTVFIAFVVYLIYREKENVNPIVYMLVLSALFAFLLASQILSFFFCFVFYALCDVLDTDSPVSSALRSLGIFSLSIGAACLLIAAGPIGFSETVNAVWWHVSAVVKRTDNSVAMLLYYWALAPLSFGFLGVFLLAAGLFLRHLFTRLKGTKPLTAAFAVFLLLVLAWGLVKFVLYGAPTVYNVTQFVLPFMAYIVVALAKKRVRSLSLTFCVLCAIGSLAMCRHLVMFGNVLASGKTFGAARALVMEKTGKNKFVTVSNGLWTLFPDINAPVARITDQYKPGDTVIMQQAYMEVPGDLKQRSDLIFEWRAPTPVTLFGVKIASRPQGYGFSIFRVK